jgi:hypothetical protein
MSHGSSPAPRAGSAASVLSPQMDAGPGSVNARRAKRGLTGSGLVRDETTSPA